MIDKSFEASLEKNGYIVTEFRGTSMNPMLVQGRDKVFIKKALPPLNRGDIALYKRRDGSYILHRVHKVYTSTYAMLGDNHFTVEYGVPFGAVLGVVEGYYRGDKYIELAKSKSYKAYKFFWCTSIFGRRILYFFKTVFSKIKKIFKKDKQ